MKLKPTLALLLLFSLLSCFSDADDKLKNQIQQEVPVATNPIGVESPLFTNLQTYTSDQPTNSSDCIQFIYPITINTFDENLEFINFTIIDDNETFITFLAGLLPENVISISYPISYTNDSGVQLEITTNEELEEKLQVCIDEELEIYCSGLFTDGECLWRVVNNPDLDGNNDYENSLFKVSSIGITTFEYNDSVLFGSWTVISTSGQLFFNIYFDESTEVASTWNKNWYLTIIDDNNMILQDGDSELFYIQRQCSAVMCPKYIFEQCETEEDSNMSMFDLESYISCFASDIDLDNFSVMFFKTEMDASTGANPLITPYTNVTNPQYIYVRIEDTNTGEFYIVKILLAATSC